MALARAFTSRRTKRPEISLPTPHRSLSTRDFAGAPTGRPKISAPTELLSTTNMLSFNAPDIHSASCSSSSGDETESSPREYPSPATSVDSSTGSRPGSPEQNHLSCYFNTPSRTPSSHGGRQSHSSTEDVPMVPQRALSHTAATHKALARKRSVQRMPPPNSIHESQEGSAQAKQAEAASVHPFVQELAQVNELAEDFGVRDSMIDEEEKILLQKGLKKFGVDDYLTEIQGLVGDVFEDKLPSMATAWI